MRTIPNNIFSSITVSQTQTAGRYHKQKQHPCEDTTLLRTGRNFLFCGLADGQSDTPYCKEGGEACLESIFSYINNVGIDSLMYTRFVDELPCIITQVYRRKLLELAGTPDRLTDFSSTLLILVLHPETGRYMLLHLGDGCAVGVDHEKDPEIISPPENGLSLNTTWLTASDNAVSHLRVSFGSVENKKRILLLSDGATCFCKGKNIPWRSKKMLMEQTAEALHQHLLESNPVDDATCIILDFGQNG